MATEYDSSRIERLKRGLYDPTAEGLGSVREEKLTPSDIDVAQNWTDAAVVQKQNESRPLPPRVGALKILVIAAAIFALFSVGYLLFEYFDPFANPSEKNIDIAFDIPVGATPGIPADIVLHITNKNRVALDYANLQISYPSGTRSGDSPGEDVHDEKKTFGTIAAGEAVLYHTKAIFLGEENAGKEIRATLEYRFSGINSIFTKNETRSIMMLAAPINLSVDMLKEINAGQPLLFSVSAVSNTTIELRDVFIKIAYPLGFTYVDADPKPDFGTNIWRVGPLLPSQTFGLKVHGVLSGEDTQEKVFHTEVGVGSDKTARDIDTIYGRTLSSLSVMRPFIGIGLALNGKPAGDVSVPFGQIVEGAVNWRNNLDAKIEQAQIEVRLRGVALNRSSVRARSGGFYRSSDDTIIWDERGEPSLAILESGASGGVGFSFQPLPPISSTQLLLNPTITVEVTVRGKRISESGVPEEIKSVMVEQVRVSSDAQFASRAVYYVGPFVNSGPIPPQVEQETTYTVIWSIVNTSSNISNTRVHAVLPVYMKWYGTVSPKEENLVYNHDTNEIVWLPGDIPAGTGVGKPPREVAFQIVLTPSLSQVKTSPDLLTGTTMTGQDAFTGAPVRVEKANIDTNLSTDPKAERGGDLVAP